eukprot:scaffold1890_cov105-Isochrysis_galbana.AAC.7
MNSCEVRKRSTPDDGQSTQTPRSRWDTPPSTPPQHTAAVPRFCARVRGHNVPTHNEKPARRASRSQLREDTSRGAPGPRNRALPAWPHPLVDAAKILSMSTSSSVLGTCTLGEGKEGRGSAVKHPYKKI